MGVSRRPAPDGDSEALLGQSKLGDGEKTWGFCTSDGGAAGSVSYFPGKKNVFTRDISHDYGDIQESFPGISDLVLRARVRVWFRSWGWLLNVLVVRT